MGLAELKEKVASLSERERFELAAYLADLDEKGEKEFRQAIDRRMKNMDAGKKVDMREFEEEHAKRSAKR